MKYDYIVDTIDGSQWCLDGGDLGAVSLEGAARGLATLLAASDGLIGPLTDTDDGAPMFVVIPAAAIVAARVLAVPPAEPAPSVDTYPPPVDDAQAVDDGAQASGTPAPDEVGLNPASVQV